MYARARKCVRARVCVCVCTCARERNGEKDIGEGELIYIDKWIKIIITTLSDLRLDFVLSLFHFVKDFFKTEFNPIHFLCESRANVSINVVYIFNKTGLVCLNMIVRVYNCFIYIRTYIHTYIHAYIHTYTHTYIHTYVLTYIHIYISMGFILWNWHVTIHTENWKQRLTTIRQWTTRSCHRDDVI